ncbi:MAG: Hsp20/alpha crystallin family protein [Bradyrhizobiaceae bacterium]|nr:Hsp20/alpha crystallin family protein [Bradyrhizobiaceae bacterium]
MNLKSLIPIGRDRSRPGQVSPFGALHREIDRLFDDFSRGFPSFGTTDLVPRMDVYETDKEIELTAELPGLEEKDVEINVADGLLTIRGEKKSEKEEKDKNYRLIERSYGSFSRTIELPAGVDPEKIKAAISKGVLKVSVPKPPAKETKKIEVKTAA